MAIKYQTLKNEDGDTIYPNIDPINNIPNRSISGLKLGLGEVGEDEIEDLGIATRNLQNGCVTTPKIANGAVTGDKIEDDSIAGVKIVDGEISTDKLADGAVTHDKVARGAIYFNNLSIFPKSFNEIFNGVTTISDAVNALSDLLSSNNLYRIRYIKNTSSVLESYDLQIGFHMTRSPFSWEIYYFDMPSQSWITLSSDNDWEGFVSTMRPYCVALMFYED